MNPGGQKQGMLRFGKFELDVGNCELRRGGIPVKLPSQPFQLLALLAARPGETVSREEIRRELWADGTFVDFDQSINFCVNKLRAALDDDPQRPRFVETVPRKGYRFIAPIVESHPEAAEAVADPAVLSKTRAPRRHWLLSATAVAILVGIALAARTAMPSRHATKPIESLAVLPLENLSQDPEQEYFADGMTDELITDLAKISALRVIPRSTVNRYKGTKEPVTQVARELDVDAVVEGTVTRDRGQVRITAQLTATAPERHLWAEKYEGSSGDIFTIQDDVANAIVRQIQIKLKPGEMAEHSSRSVNAEAYDAFLRGYYLHPTDANLPKMRDYFQLAIDKDSGYAAAWRWLGESYNLMALRGVMSRREAIPRARTAAEKAAQLDPTSVGPIGILANIKQNYEWDWAGAEREYQHAFQLNSKAPAVRMQYATELAEVGRTREAIAQALRAREVAPLIYEPNLYVAWYYYIDRQYERAEAEARKLIEWEPALSGGYVVQASVYLQTGKRPEAVAGFQKAALVSNRSAKELMYLGHALGITGDQTGGRTVLKELLSRSERGYVPPDFIAIVYEGVGDRDRALQWFEKAYAERSMNEWTLPDPRLDTIRSDPRFKNILRRMGLAR